MLAKKLKRPATAVWLELVVQVVTEAPIAYDAAFVRCCAVMQVEPTRYQAERFKKVCDLLHIRSKILIETKAGQPVLLRVNPGAA